MISIFSKYRYDWKLLPWMFLFFVIPVFPFLVSSAIVTVLIGFLLRYRDVRFQRENFHFLIFPLLFFAVYLVGLFWTDTHGMRTVVVERKLSFLIFPLLFLLHPPFSSKERSSLWISFISGGLLYSLISVIQASLSFASSGNRDSFFSSALSYELHPSYSAFYLVMMIAYLMWQLFRMGSNSRFRIAGFILIFWFSLFVFLLASKAGIISLLLICVLLMIYFLFLRKKVKQLIWVLGVGILLVFFFVRFASVPFERFRNAFTVAEISDEELFSKYGSSIESNVVRRMIWKCGFELVHENPFGVGSGDANTALMQKYKEKGMSGAYSKEFNAHNQFLQTSIATGWIGLVLLLVFFIQNFVFSWRRGNYLLFGFLLVCALNLMVESMFETQAGIVFIILFFCFLCTDSEKNNEIYI